MISKSVLSKDFPLIIDFQIFFLELFCLSAYFGQTFFKNSIFQKGFSKVA